jgi:hypothetical protein
MGRPFDPARDTRARLALMEQRAKTQADARAVAEGVQETVALSRSRGAAIVKEPAARGGRDTPYRRQTGLEWLARKGRISERQAQAGLRYGEAFRRAEAAPAIGSTLEVQPGGNLQSGPPLAMLVKLANGRRQAEGVLADYRRRLMEQPDLVNACDLCCGRELTPREAAGGERDGGRLEAILRVALDILARG